MTILAFDLFDLIFSDRVDDSHDRSFFDAYKELSQYLERKALYETLPRDYRELFTRDEYMTLLDLYHLPIRKE